MDRTYAFRAKNLAGKTLDGLVTADSEAAAAAFIRDRGFFILQIKERKRTGNLLASILTYGRKPPVKDIAVFCRQFSAMLTAGLNLLNCLTVLADQTGSKYFRAALWDVKFKVETGMMLSEALHDHPLIFPNLLTTMIKAGEVGGVLDKVFYRLAVYQEQAGKIREKLKSAMVYPLVISLFAGLSFFLMINYLLPTFEKMYYDMGVFLPDQTKLIFVVNRFIHHHGEIMLLIFLAITGLFMISLRERAIACRWEKLVLTLPVVGPFWRKVIIVRFTRLLSVLLGAGISLITALSVIAEATGSPVFSARLRQAEYQVRNGQSFAKTMREMNFFPPLAIQIITVGEEIGHLDQMLDKIADYYEADIDTAATRLTGLLEPVLIGFIGMVIGGFLIAVILPLFDLITTMPV